MWMFHFPFSKRTSYHRWSFVSSEMYIKCHMICNPCNASDTVRCEWLRENWCRQTHRRPVFRSHGRYTIQSNGQFFLETQRSETDSNEIPISPNPNVNIRTNAIFYFMNACLLHEKINTFFDGKISEYKYYLRDGERTVQWEMLLWKMCTLYTVYCVCSCPWCCFHRIIFERSDNSLRSIFLSHDVFLNMTVDCNMNIHWVGWQTLWPI